MTDNISKREQLYTNLLGTGKVTEQEIGTKEQFLSAISDRNKASEFHKNLQSVFRKDEIGDELEFLSSIEPDFNKPNPVNTFLSKQPQGVQGVVNSALKQGWDKKKDEIATQQPAIPLYQQKEQEPQIDNVSTKSVADQINDIKVENQDLLARYNIIDSKIKGVEGASRSASGLGEMSPTSMAYLMNRSKVSKEDREFYDNNKEKFEQVNSRIKTLSLQQDLEKLIQDEQGYDPNSSNVRLFVDNLFNKGLAKDFVTLGLTEIDRNFALGDVLNKAVNQPDQLNAEEKQLINTYQTLTQLQSREKKWTADAGRQLREAGSFIIQMMITGGLGSGVRAGIESALKVGAKKGFQNFARKQAAGLLFNIPRATMTTSLGQRYSQNRLGNYEVGTDGVNLRVDANSALKDLGNSWIQNYLEYATEELAFMPDGIAKKVLANPKLQKLFGNGIGKIQKVIDSDSYQSIKKITDYAQVQGVPTEILQESINAGLSTILTGSEDAKELTNPAFYKSIALNSMIMGGAFGSVNLVGSQINNQVEKNRINKNADRSLSALYNMWGVIPAEEIQDEISALISSIRGGKFMDKDGKIENGDVLQSLDRLGKLAEQFPEQEEILSIASKAVADNAKKYGAYLGIESLAEKETGGKIAFERDPEKVVIATKGDQKFYVIDDLPQEDGRSIMIVRPIEGGENISMNSIEFDEFEVAPKDAFLNAWLSTRNELEPVIAEAEAEQGEIEAIAEETPAATIEIGKDYLLGGIPVNVIDITEDGIIAKDEQGNTYTAEQEELSEIPAQIQEAINEENIFELSPELSPEQSEESGQLEEAQPQAQQIPLTKKGEPDYDAMSPDMLVEQMTANGFTPDDISEVVNGTIQSLEKQRKSIEKKDTKSINDALNKKKQLKEIDDRLNDLKSVSTNYTQQRSQNSEQGQDDQYTAKFNTLLAMVKGHNAQTPAKKKGSNITGLIKKANELGLIIRPDGYNTLQIEDSQGNIKSRRITTQVEKNVVQEHKALQDYSQDIQGFIMRMFEFPDQLVYIYGGDRNVLIQGMNNILEGEKTLAANELLDKLESTFNYGSVSLIPPDGSSPVDVPIEDYFTIMNENEDLPEDVISQDMPDFEGMFEDIMDLPEDTQIEKNENNNITLPSNEETVIPTNEAAEVQSDEQQTISETEQGGDSGVIAQSQANVSEGEQLASQIQQEEAKVNTEPTEGQKEAGNYQKGHITIQGLDITIEQPKGSVRSGVDKDGKEWSQTMNNTYGYALGTTSRDGDHIDIFIGDNPLSDKVFVVDQINKDKSFDEHKVMIGFDSVEQAKDAYLSNYEEGWQGLGNITETTMEQLKEWGLSEGKRIKPFADYKAVAEQPQQKESWQMTREEFIQEKDLVNSKPNKKDLPTETVYKIGDKYIEFGNDPYIFEYREIDPNTVDYSEKWQVEQGVLDRDDTQQYIKWFKEGKMPMPITVVFNKSDKKLTSTNRRRLLAAREAGVKTIPAWVEIGKHSEIIQQALSEGKQVPAEVLKDYPELQKTVAEVKEEGEIQSLKQSQFDVISNTNPMLDEYRTGIRSVSDILTAEEAFSKDDIPFTPDFNQEDAQNALKSGRITIYSSYPIQQGVFVTPSKMEAQNYAGRDKVYSKEVALTDVAWIDGIEGQYTGDDVLYRSQPYFYSPTEQALNAIKQEKGTPEQWKAMLLKNGAKEAEMDWMDFDGFVEGKKSITKSELQEWINQNKIEVQEVEKRENDESESEFELTDWAEERVSELREVESEFEQLVEEEQYNEDFSAEQQERLNLLYEQYGTPNAIGESLIPSILEESENYEAKTEDTTKYSQYQLPGGENYKELLLVMPERKRPLDKWAYYESKGVTKESYDKLSVLEQSILFKEWVEYFDASNYLKPQDFHSSHFAEPNILAHIRFNERTDSKGNKVLFLEEIQSDWAQKGKKEGFGGKPNYKKEGDIYKVYDGAGVFFLDTKTEEEAKETIRTNPILSEQGVPDMPFKNTDQWVNLALRRMMIYAAENGFDRVAWTNGDMQAGRYDLSKQVDRLVIDEEGGKYTVMAIPKGESELKEVATTTKEKLSDYVGKEIATKAIEEGGGDFRGNDLKIGGSGMKAFYDNIIPAQANKVGKKFGAKVEVVDIPTGEVIYDESVEIDVSDLSSEAQEISNRYEDSLEEGGDYSADDYVRDMASVGYQVEMDYNSGEPISVTTASTTKTAKVNSIPITDAIREQAKVGMPMFSITGEQSSRAMDSSNEAMIRLDNLEIAREMEAKGKDSKTIRLATGWEKGADGKWRYEEIDDLKIKAFPTILEGEYKFFKFDEVFDSKMLFTAYPQIKDVRVFIYNNPEQDSLGGFIEQANTLELNAGNKLYKGLVYQRDGQLSADNASNQSGQNGNDYETILGQSVIHEVQHIIQSYEDFTRGSSSRDIQDLYPEAIRREIEIIRGLENAETRQVSDAALQTIAAKRIYRKLSGEVEARNAAKRLSLTPEQRRNTLLQETEDVSREDQILLENLIEESNGNLTQQAQEFADNLGVEVNITTDINTIPASQTKKRQAKGWFDPKTKQIYVAIPNNRDVADIQATILHEAVGHKGLRGLLGGNFNPTMAKVFQSLPKPTQADLLAKFTDRITAAEEYLSTLAEQDITPSLWDKIVSIIRDAFRALGIDLSISDTDMAYMLWRSKNRLKTANPTALEINSDRVESERVKERMRSEMEGETIIVDGVERPTRNSEGRFIHPTLEGIENFWRWFGDSKVVDKEGKPLVVYHGTGSDFDAFEPNRGDVGIHFGTRAQADWINVRRSYRKGEKEGVSIMPIYASIKNPIRLIDNGGFQSDDVLSQLKNLNIIEKTHPLSKKTTISEKELLENISQLIILKGYDGVVYENEFEGYRKEDSYIALNPSQIKSINNSGDFSSETANILFRDSETPMPLTNDLSLTYFQEKREMFQDRMISGKVLLDAIRKRGGKISVFTDFVSEELRSSSRAQAETDDFINNYFKPLTIKIGEFVSKGSTQAEVEDYLKAKHAPEVNKNITTREARKSVGYAYQKQIRELTEQLAQEKDEKKAKRIRRAIEVVNGQLAFYADAKNADLITTILSGAYDQVFNGADMPVLSPMDTLSFMLATDVLKKAVSQYKKIQKSEMSNIRSGKSDMEAKEIVDAFEARFDGEDINELWDKVRKSTDFAIIKSFKYGLISKETFDRTKSMYQYYVPLRGWEETEDIDYADLFGSNYMGAEILSNVNKEAKGRTSEADSPLSFIGSMAETAIVSGNKNEVRKQAWRLVLNNVEMRDLFLIKDAWETNIAEIGEEPEWEITYEVPTQEQIESGNARRRKPNREYEWHKTRSQMTIHQVPVLINGEKVVVEFKGNIGAKVASAINGTNRDFIKSRSGQWIANTTRIMSALKTSKNPSFVLTNFSRDFFFGTMAYYVRGGNPLALAANLAVAWKAIDKNFRGKEFDAKLMEWRTDFEMEGGKTGYVYMLGQEKFKKKAEQLVKEANEAAKISPTIYARKAWKALNHGMDYLAIMSEDAMRFALYITEIERMTKEAGIDKPTDAMKKKAALMAKELTTNFNRKGTNAFFSSYFAFFNASIQGSYNYIKLAKENPQRFIGYHIALLTLRAGLHALCTLIDDDKEYEKGMSQYAKDNNFIIPMAGSYLTIPLPHGARALTSLGNLAVDVVIGKRDPQDATLEYMKNIAAELTPINIAGLEKNAFIFPSTAEAALLTITPTIVRPWAEIAVNIDFKNDPIEREPFLATDKDYTPRWQLAQPYTNRLVLGGTKVVNRWAGGNDERSAGIRVTKEGEVTRSEFRRIFDFSPAKIEHLIEGYLGGAGKFVNDVYKTTSVLAQGEVPDKRIVPIVNRFYQSPIVSGDWKMYYEIRERVNDINAAKEAAKDVGDNNQFVTINNLYNNEIVAEFDRYNKAIRALSKQRNLLNEDDPRREEKSKELDKRVSQLVLGVRKIDEKYNKK